MATEKNSVQLTTGVDQSFLVDKAKCIICQETSSEKVIGTKNGCKRVRDAALIRDDIVRKRLKVVDQEDFVYHVSNSCYKAYTMKSHLERLLKKRGSAEACSDESGQKRTCRSSLIPRPQPTPDRAIYEKNCVVCGFIKHQGVYEKYRISELNRAMKFLEATVFMQDDVYTRTCDLQGAHAVFGADLYCHKQCINRYLIEYERVRNSSRGVKDSCNWKREAVERIIPNIELGLANGEGYELSYVRDLMNKNLSEACITNREMKVLLLNHFAGEISFSRPKQLNKSELFFSKGVTTEHMAETIRSTDPIRECAQMIRQSLLDVYFDLQDRFCDANDLKTSWNSVPIPEPLLKFLATLFNFDATAFAAGPQVSDDDEDDKSSDENSGISESRFRQMHCLFQVLHHDLHRGRFRTPLHIMNSQAIYDACKSATLITSFNRFGLCCSYDELMRHQNDMASFTVFNSSNKVPFPSHFDKTMFTVGAFDNFDHNEANLSGMGGSHDTVSVLFQDDGGSNDRKPRRSETEVEHGARTFTVELKCQSLKQFYKPAKKPNLPEDYLVSNTIPVDEDVQNEVKTKEIAWQLCRMDLSKDTPQRLNVRPKSQVMPIWSAANSVLSIKDIPLKRVAFLPVLPYPVTEYDSVYTALTNFQAVLEFLDQSKLPVTCDEGVYRIARKIQLIRPLEFENIVLCLGSFHMAKVWLSCIGKYIKGSGAENILIESGVFGVNVVQSVLTGKNYVRSLKGMQLLKEAFSRLQWAAFFKEDDHTAKYENILDSLQLLKEEVAIKSPLSVPHLKTCQADIGSVLVKDFQLFISKCCEKSETFKFGTLFCT